MEVFGILDPLDGQIAFTAIPGAAAIDSENGTCCGDSSQLQGVTMVPGLDSSGGAERGEEYLPPLSRSVTFVGNVDVAVIEGQVGLDDEAAVVEFHGLVHVLRE